MEKHKTDDKRNRKNLNNTNNLNNNEIWIPRAF